MHTFQCQFDKNLQMNGNINFVTCSLSLQQIIHKLLHFYSSEEKIVHKKLIPIHSLKKSLINFSFIFNRLKNYSIGKVDNRAALTGNQNEEQD